MRGKKIIMSPPTLSAVARQHGISRNTLQRWRDGGLDITDETAVAARVATMRKPSSAETAAPSSPGSESYAEAKRRRASADANLAEMKAAQQMGKLIDLATVEQAFAEIGFVLRARLLALPSNLVSELEGLTPAQIHQTLKKHIHQLLHDLHENSPIEKLTASSTSSTSSTTTAAKDTSRG
jgi:phage terminase Nu1 subunit (DNA packaging protein)